MKARPYPKGIRQHRGQWEVFVRRNGAFRSKTLPLETDMLTLKRERETLLASLVLNVHDPQATTFAEDAADYLTLVADMPSYGDRKYHIGQWVEAFGPRPRKTITARDIAGVLESWRKTGAVDGGPLSPASLNRRRTALMSLYTRLDGRSQPNLVKDVEPFSEDYSSQVRALPMSTVAAVIARLKRSSATRARLDVLLWTGWPHALLKALKASDVDWQGQKVRLSRRQKGKGMSAAWVPVLPEAITALRRFARMKAWGSFSNSSMHKALRRAVARENTARAERKLAPLPPIHPYMIRHSMATWAAGIVKDDQALKQLLRTNSIERYTAGALAARLTDARDVLSANSANSYAPFAPRRHKDREGQAREPEPRPGHGKREKRA